MERLWILLLFGILEAIVASCRAVNLQERQSLTPSVTIQNGTVVGSSDGVVESFRGIPYAQPPVDQLRLKPPKSITQSFGTIEAVGVPTACPQFLVANVNTSSLPAGVASIVDELFVAANGPSGEDCLTLNVQRPANTTSTSKLPVVFWIYGGGFEFGSTQMYDGTSLITKSITLGEPIIYVAVNYRVGGFGFLPGKELQKDGSTNLGLRDQRLGLEWVAENIEAFGGDPAKVTIWGESAGSASVFLQTILYGGDNTYNGNPLFRGAIMDSGSTQPSNTVTSKKSQKVFDTVAGTSGCSTSSDILACLRGLPYQKYLTAVNSLPGIFSYQSLDEAYFPKPDPSTNFYSVSPEIAVQRGAYVKVPTIIGDQEDEGTLFSLEQANITTTDQLVTYINSVFATAGRNVNAGLVRTYPANPAAGSPFRTGAANEIYPQYKRLAAIFGDMLFTLQRRIYLDHISFTQPTWSYLASYLHGTPVLGTFHATDIFELYFDAPNPYPTETIQTFYISFINSLDPNNITNTGTILWPSYNTTTRSLIHFQALQNTILKDNFRQNSYEYIKKHQSQLRFG